MNASTVRLPQAGFALSALIFFLTAATILIAATVPVYQMQAKRAQEEELIFRGEEYARAILKFKTKFNVLPPSLEALQQTNGIRFVRKLYKDPITGKPFRLISIDGATGALIGSNLANPNSNNRGGPFGSPTSIGLPGGGSPFPATPTTSSPNSNPANRGAGVPPNNNRGPAPAPSAGLPVSNNPRPGGLQPGGTNTPQAAGSAGIIGVGSDSEGESIKVYNGRKKYTEWEFIAQVQLQPTADPGNRGRGNPNDPANNNPGAQQPTPNRGFSFPPTGNPVGTPGNPVGAGSQGPTFGPRPPSPGFGPQPQQPGFGPQPQQPQFPQGPPRRP